MSRIRLLCVAGIVWVCGTAAAVPLTLVSNLPGQFTDISETGTPLPLGGDLEYPISTDTGNIVFPAGTVIVGNNGGLGFGLGRQELGPDNQPIPSGNAFGGAQSALPFWDDIGNDTGSVLFQETRGTLIVQWQNVHFEGPDGRQDTATFQVKIFSDPGPDQIFAQFIYADIEQPRPGGGISATIGYQDGPANFNDVQWSFNEAGAVQNGTVLSLVAVPEPGALAMALLLLVRARR